VFFKLCGDRVIGRLLVGQVTRNDYDHPRIVWRATLTPGSTGAKRLALTDAVPGYRVINRLGPGLQASLHYMLVDAADQKGVNVLPTVNDFRGREIREGVIVEDGKPHLLSRWLGPQGPMCR
jgi:hypothetical protein